MDKATFDIITKSHDDRAWYEAVMTTPVKSVVDQTMAFYQHGEKDFPEEKKTPHEKLISVSRHALQSTLAHFPEGEWESIIDKLGDALHNPDSELVKTFMGLFGAVGERIAKDYNMKDPISEEQLRSDIIAIRWPIDQLHDFWNEKNKEHPCACPFCLLSSGEEVDDKDIVFEVRTRASVAIKLREYAEKNQDRLKTDQLARLEELYGNIL